MKISKKILRDLKNRQEKAFNIIYHEYYKLIYYVALKITKDETLAQDIMQDTFVKFMENIENYQDDGHLRQYLTTITRNLALNLVTKKETINLDSIKEPSTNDNNNIELILTLKNTLDEDESNIVILKIIYDYNFREIAEDTNSTIGIVQAKYYKALKKLKNHFEGDNLK